MAGEAILAALDREDARLRWEVAHLRTITAGWDGTADEVGSLAIELWDAYTALEAAGAVRWDQYTKDGRPGWVKVPPPRRKSPRRDDSGEERRREAWLQAAIAGWLRDVAGAEPDNRWKTLTRCAMRAGEYGLPVEVALELADASNLDEHPRRRRYYATSAWEKGRQRPREVILRG